MRFRSPGTLTLAVGLTLITTLDRYAVPNANLVLVAAPHSGPRRAERAIRDTVNQLRALLG